MRSSTARVASTGESERSRKRARSSTAVRSWRALISRTVRAVAGRSLPAQRGEVVGEDRRAAPQALQPLVRDRELGQLEQVDVDAVGRELALQVAEDLQPRLLVGGRVV